MELAAPDRPLAVRTPGAQLLPLEAIKIGTELPAACALEVADLDVCTSDCRSSRAWWSVVGTQTLKSAPASLRWSPL